MIDGILRQADTVNAMWNSLGARVAASQDAKDLASIPHGKGTVFNAAWLAILGPFFEEHVLQSTVEDNDVFLTEFDAKAGARAAGFRSRSDGSPEPQQQATGYASSRRKRCLRLLLVMVGFYDI